MSVIGRKTSQRWVIYAGWCALQMFNRVGNEEITFLVSRQQYISMMSTQNNPFPTPQTMAGPH